MPSYAVAMPSASASGSPIAIGTGGTTVHTTPSNTTGCDEIWIWVSNYHATQAADLTVFSSGTVMFFNIPPKTPPQLVFPGIRLNNGMSVTLTASIASALNAMVNINRITF